MTGQQIFVEEKTPSAIALAGTSRVTNDKLVALAVSRMRKYRKYAKVVDNKANPITGSTTPLPGIGNSHGRSINNTTGINNIVEAVS